MRILLIEDDPSTAESIELMLKKADLNVYVTDSGEEGIELAKLYDYDLIVLDLSLPDIDGYEVLRKLRLARIETPTLILYGPDDHVTPRDFAKKCEIAFPNRTGPLIVPEAGHFLQWERADVLNEVARFYFGDLRTRG